MKHPFRLLALVPVLGLTLSALVVPSSAGPDKIKFPDGWKSHVMYTTVDRYDIKQFRELYASSQAAVDAMKAGKPLPDGTVLTLVQYKAEVDAAGAPVKGAERALRQGRPDRPDRDGEARGVRDGVSARAAQRRLGVRRLQRGRAC